MFCFLLWPLFARAPRRWFLETFLLSAPGVQSVFFCCAPLGAATFRRGQSKKKHHPGCFFFAPAPAKGKGRRSPVGRRHGASPSPAFPRGRSKKNTLGGVFFFLLRPRADAHSLTAGLGGDASPSPGWCFFFFSAAPPGPGWCFFFFAVAPPGRSLTHCGLGRFRQGPGGVFFLLRPRRVFLDNNKKCLGYYIGSKKTRRGHSKKKKTPLPLAAGFGALILLYL